MCWPGFLGCDSHLEVIRGLPGRSLGLGRVLRRLTITEIAGSYLQRTTNAPHYDVQISYEQIRNFLLAAKDGKSPFYVYNIAGGEELSYKEMVERIFEGFGFKPRFLSVSIGAVQSLIRLTRWVPGLRFLTPEMANRMAQDLVYSNEEAVRDLAYNPRSFQPFAEEQGKW